MTGFIYQQRFYPAEKSEKERLKFNYYGKSQLMRKHKSSSIHSVHCSKLYNQLSSKSSCQLDFKHQQTMLCRNRPGCFYTGNPSRALLAGVPQRGLWIPMKRSLSGRQSNSLIHCRRNCAVQRLQLSVGLLHDDGSLSSSSAVSMLSCWSSAGS